MTELAGRWLRVSTAGQNEASQEPDIDRHIADHGYRATRTYRLHAKSASKGEQDEQLEHVVRDIEDGLITVLVAWTLDRLDRRGIAESFAVKMRIEEAGGRVEFVLEPSMDDLTFAVRAWMAEQESRRKTERSAIGLAMTRANGGAIGKPPFGYRVTGAKQNKKWVPTAEGKRYIPEVYRRIADGESLNQVAEWLNSTAPAKYTGTGDNRRRSGWHGRVLGRMIRNRTYMGYAVNGQGVITHRCEPLVDAGTWQRANDVLASSRHRKHGPNGSRALLAGVLRCGQPGCGLVMYRTTQQPDHRIRYYRCTASHGRWVSQPDLDAWVDAQMSAHGGFVLREYAVPGMTYDAEIKAAEFELQNLGRQGLGWDAEDAERARLRAEIRRLRGLPAVPPRLEQEVMPITVGDTWQMLPGTDARRAFLHAAKITVYAAPGDYRIDGDPAHLGSSGELWDLVEERLERASP